MIKAIFAALIILISPVVAQAKLHIDVSDPQLEITTGFTGDTLTLFGTAQPKGDIVIIVKGAQRQTTLRRKANIGGIWLNAQSVTFNKVPGYYNVASSAPIDDIMDNEMASKMRLGINGLTFNTEENIDKNTQARFEEALIQNKQLNGLFSLNPDAIIYLNDTLFKTRIHMPSNVPIGDYTIEAMLFRNGELIDRASHPFSIKQVGMAAQIHDFANDAPFTYGLSVIIFALFSSLLAILLLRRE